MGQLCGVMMNISMMATADFVAPRKPILMQTDDGGLRERIRGMIDECVVCSGCVYTKDIHVRQVEPLS